MYVCMDMSVCVCVRESEFVNNVRVRVCEWSVSGGSIVWMHM